MSSLNNSKLGKFLSSKGFYIALAICIVGAGTAAWVAIDTTMNNLTAEDEKKIEAPVSPSSSAPSRAESADWGFSSLNEVEKKVDGVRKEGASSGAAKESASSRADASSASSSASSSAAPKPASSSQPAQDVLKPSEQPVGAQKQPSAQQPLAFSLPILSEVFNPFSNGELVKNKTLGDWRTHDGIDIKAEKGVDVMACADGKVSRIYDDALWGTCLEMEHSGGLVSVYCGLDKGSLVVKEGDEVKVKDPIGKVDKIPCEISLENHLHFGLKQGGKWVDPVTTMGLS